MKRLIIDLDGTITKENPCIAYKDKEPNIEVISRIRQYQEMGFTIVIHTARNMRSFNDCIGKINAHTLPTIIEWLKRHQVPYDEIYIGKPWCGTEGFYVDDRAIRPSEFISLSHEEVSALIGPTSAA